MKTKPRGLRRKCQNMVRRLEEQTTTFSKPHQDSHYWHLHPPVAYHLIDSEATPFGVRRLCVQTLIDRARHLIDITPDGQSEIRVVVAVTLPELSTSQIIVFFGMDYFTQFFERNTQAPRWLEMSGKSLVKEWGLLLPEGLSERGYAELRREDDKERINHVWFIGQI